jgi:dienelactone hydrolase
MLSITDNAPGSPQNVSLTGTGSVVELNPTGLAFGVVTAGNSKSLSTTLTNAGSTTLNFSGITTTGTDADEFSQTNTCGSSVGAGKSCIITVTFRPSEAGSDSAQVSISDNGGGPQQVPLSGSGCVVTKGRCKTAPVSSPAVRSAIAAQSMVAVPSPTGPSKVGTRVVDFVDSTRDDPFLAENIKRELLVRFWYPTPAGQDCKLADYTSPAVWARFSQLLAVPLPDVKTNSCLDAPMTDGLHPVVVFTHGYTGTFTDYTFLYEDLASRGYVVVSVDHTYEATAVEFPDGRLATSVLGSYLANNWRVDDETLQFVVSVRLDDLRFVLNQLQRINNEASGPFDGKLDMSRVALAGHSLGGLTTLLGVRADSRFRAGILLDPYLSEDVSNPTLTSVLLLAAGRTEWSENELSLWNDLQGPRFAVNFRGAEHVMPSDAVWLAKGAIQTGDMGPDKTIAAIRNYIAAFLDANLRDQPLDPLLKGPSSDYPDAEVTTQRNLLRGRP